MYGTGTSGRATSGHARARRDAFENSSGARSPRAAPTSVANDLLARHPLRLGHRGASPLVDPLAGTDESERHGGRTSTRLRPKRSYTTLRDVTKGARCLEDGCWHRDDELARIAFFPGGMVLVCVGLR